MLRSTLLASVCLAVSLLTTLSAKPAQAADLDKALEGSWKVSSAMRAGTPSEEPVGDTVTFNGATMTIKTKNDDDQPKLTISTDTSKTPHQINFTMERNGTSIKVFGIYKVTGDKLEICMSQPGEPRPTKLQSQPESKEMSVVATKVASP